MTAKKTVKPVKDVKPVTDDQTLLALQIDAIKSMKLWANPGQIKYIRRNKVLEKLMAEYDG